MAADSIEEPHQVLYLVRTFRVPRETLFGYLLDPREIKKWWRPTEDHEVVLVDLELRDGGNWRIGMKPPDGEPYYASGSFREIRAPRWVVLTWNWEGPRTWAREPVDTPPPESVVVWQLRERDGGQATEFFFWHNGLLDERDVEEHKWGWSGILDSLERHVSF
jgi:uncharacterized protein YndB with AHSA1/START domain